jgi:hypothetical protein
MGKYKVIQDTREKQGWEFAPSKHCEGMVVGTLKTGDYTLEGYEDVLCIERKGSVSEVSGNLCHPDKWPAFERELARLDAFPHPFIILEFTIDQLVQHPIGSGIPKSRFWQVKVKGPFLLKRLIEIQLDHRCQIVFAGDRGKEYASSIFKRVVERAQAAPAS